MSVTRSDGSVSIDFEGAPVSAANPLPVEATIEVGDIEIGAVELKDASTANRATINAAGELLVNPSGSTAGTATHTADNTVTNASEIILAANANRKAAYVQVVSGGNARVTIDGVDATTTLGIQVSAGGAPLVIQAPFCPTAAIKAIREGATDAVVQVVEIV